MANKENTSDEGLRVSYDVKTYHSVIYIIIRFSPE